MPNHRQKENAQNVNKLKIAVGCVFLTFHFLQQTEFVNLTLAPRHRRKVQLRNYTGSGPTSSGRLLMVKSRLTWSILTQKRIWIWLPLTEILLALEVPILASFSGIGFVLWCCSGIWITFWASSKFMISGARRPVHSDRLWLQRRRNNRSCRVLGPF